MNLWKYFVGKVYLFYLRNIKRYWTNYSILRAAPRRYLEYRFFPRFYADGEIQNILLVGVAPYTRHYADYFKGKKGVWSIDVDPERANSGVAGQHIIDSVENVDKYFKEGSIDCVIMNGVYGWGLDKEEAVVKTLDGIKKILRKGGILLFGWNKVPKYDPIYLDGRPYFNGLERFKINGASRTELDAKHHDVFDVYRKP